MDFAFSPGTDEHLSNLRGMFARETNTTVIAARPVTSVRQFITHLDTTPGIVKPIGDLLIGTHANDGGQLSVPVGAGQRDWTIYETVEKTLSDPARSIKIPDALIGFTAGGPVTHAVHLKGCNVGSAGPFLLKLKEAFGGHVKVTAPKFFHGATPSKVQGWFEYMGYEFVVRRAKPFPNRAAALAEFDAAQFKLVDATTVVPAADWNRLIPPDPNKRRAEQIDSKLGITLAKRTTIRTPRQYRVIPITFGPWTVPFPDVASVPTDESGKLLELTIHLKTDKRFQTTHVFPQWQREGFANLTEFVSGYTWDCRRRGTSLVCFGTRMLYLIAMAVTDPATTPTGGFFGDGNLIFNFYPHAGSTLTPITNALTVTDPKFFATV